MYKTEDIIINYLQQSVPCLSIISLFQHRPQSFARRVRPERVFCKEPKKLSSLG